MTCVLVAHLEVVSLSVVYVFTVVFEFKDNIWPCDHHLRIFIVPVTGQYPFSCKPNSRAILPHSNMAMKVRRDSLAMRNIYKIIFYFSWSSIDDLDSVVRDSLDS